MKTLRLNPTLHIEFDPSLRAALIFPLSHTVQCTASDTPMKISLFDLNHKIYNGQREEKAHKKGGRGVHWGKGGAWLDEGVNERATLMSSVFALTTANGRVATVWVFFLFLSGNQSVQRR